MGSPSATPARGIVLYRPIMLLPCAQTPQLLIICTQWSTIQPPWLLLCSLALLFGPRIWQEHTCLRAFALPDLLHVLMTHSLTSFRPLIKCDLSREAFPAHSNWNHYHCFLTLLDFPFKPISLPDITFISRCVLSLSVSPIPQSDYCSSLYPQHLGQFLGLNWH